MIRTVLALVLVTMVMGEGCCPYDAWEGYLGLVSGTIESGQSHLTRGGFMVHMNSTRKIVASDVDLNVDGIGITMKTIQDFRKGTEYDVWQGKCSKKLLGPWKSRCIPSDAKVLQNSYIGAGTVKVAVKTYSYTDNGLQVYTTVTASGCVPIVSTMSGITLQGVPTVSVTEFSGITPGVKDPSVFNIPAICNFLGIPRHLFGTINR